MVLTNDHSTKIIINGQKYILKNPLINVVRNNNNLYLTY